MAEVSPSPRNLVEGPFAGRSENVLGGSQWRLNPAHVVTCLLLAECGRSDAGWSNGSAQGARKFVLEWERRWNEGQGKANVAELCGFFGVSRETGYRWIDRYRQNGHRVKLPRSSPRKAAETNSTWCIDFQGEVLASKRAVLPRARSRGRVQTLPSRRSARRRVELSRMSGLAQVGLDGA